MVQVNVISQLLHQQMRTPEGGAEAQPEGAFATLFAALAPAPEAAPVKHSLLPSTAFKGASRDDLITLPEQPPGPPIFAQTVALPVPANVNALPVPPAALSPVLESPLPVTAHPLIQPGNGIIKQPIATPVEPAVAHAAATPPAGFKEAAVSTAAPATTAVEPLVRAQVQTQTQAQTQPAAPEQAAKSAELAQATINSRANTAELRETMQPAAPVVSQLASATATLRGSSVPEVAPKPLTNTSANGIQIIMTDAPVAGSTAAAASQPAPQAIPAAALPQLTAPVGSPAWQTQLQQNMVQMVMHNQQQVTLRLNPADLGPIQMQLQLDDTSAQLNILTHSNQVRGALETAMPQLREALASQGIQLTDSQVGQQGSQQQQPQQSPQQQRGMQWSAKGNDRSPVTDSASLTSPAGDSVHQGQVDIYA
ncbi:flagellar hook-length control protein FliK [Pseudidiomarina sp.]|uniref:flagellar hook-length control protein FliK n=1 Tax=Pseudidiomarina sp. TaxID=2081707 RepID=UPI00299E7F83|nr:flagellar hook-length control protein FliK [Pseudidiomarina sp.]MDX1705760.1 flagellar hook-length control protein FliK [Pseudidiomarina sp.]